MSTVIGIHLTGCCIKSHIRRSLISYTLIYWCTVNSWSFFLSLRFEFTSRSGYKRLIELFFILPCYSVLHDTLTIIGICWRLTTTSFLDWFSHGDSTIIDRIVKFIWVYSLKVFVFSLDFSCWWSIQFNFFYLTLWFVNTEV